MKFEDALQELRKGKSIQSPSDIYTLEEIKKDQGIEIDIDDLFSDKWKIYEEPGKTFPEVFEDFKNYKKVRRKYWPDNYFIEKDERLHELGQQDLLANDWEIID